MTPIRDKIREVIGRGVRDPDVISNKVILYLTDQEAREALRITLPYLVREELRQHHRARGRVTVTNGDGPLTRSDIGRPDPPPNEFEQARQRRETAQRAADASQARRDRDRELLAMPIPIRMGETKALRDCSPEELREAAHWIRDKAADQAVRLERLADRLDQARVRTVGEGFKKAGIRDQFVGAPS